MSTKRTLTISATMLVVILGLAASALAAPSKNGTVTIRHELRGCHSWAVSGGAFKATQMLTLGVHRTLTVTNNDVMPHALLQLSGAKLALQSPLMAHMSATAKVTFPKAGVYVLGTKAGEDYMKGVKTIGADNVLRLVVTVR